MNALSRTERPSRAQSHSRPTMTSTRRPCHRPATAFGRTRLSARLTWGRHRQDDAFLPYSTNRVARRGSLCPLTGLGGRCPARSPALSTLRVVSQVSRRRLRLSLTSSRARARQPVVHVLMLMPVLAEDLIITPPVPNRAYSVRRQHTDASVRYRAWPRTTLVVGARSTRSRRTPLEIAGNDERGAWLDLATRWPAGFAVSIKASASTRDATAFEHVTRNNPLTRRYYQAARERDRWRARIDYSPAGIDASFGLNADYTSNTYPSSPLGLRAVPEPGVGWRLRDHAKAEPELRRIPRVAHCGREHGRQPSLPDHRLVVRDTRPDANDRARRARDRRGRSEVGHRVDLQPLPWPRSLCNDHRPRRARLPGPRLRPSLGLRGGNLPVAPENRRDRPLVLGGLLERRLGTRRRLTDGDPQRTRFRTASTDLHQQLRRARPGATHAAIAGLV